MLRFKTEKYRDDPGGLTHRVIDTDPAMRQLVGFARNAKGQVIVDEAMRPDEAQDFADSCNSIHACYNLERGATTDT